MKLSIVLNFDVPIHDNVSDPRRGELLGEAAVEIFAAMKPPTLPYFVDQTHVLPGELAEGLAAWLSSELADPADLAKLEQLGRDFDHYANHGDPAVGADTLFRLLQNHILAVYLLAAGKATVAEVAAELDEKDRLIADDAIAAGATSPVGQRRQGSAFGL